METIIKQDYFLWDKICFKPKTVEETKWSMLSYAIEHMDLTDIYRTFHPAAVKYTFFSSVMEHSRIDHMLGHNTSHKKCKQIEIT